MALHQKKTTHETDVDIPTTVRGKEMITQNFCVFNVYLTLDVCVWERNEWEKEKVYLLFAFSSHLLRPHFGVQPLFSPLALWSDSNTASYFCRACTHNRHPPKHAHGELNG